MKKSKKLGVIDLGINKKFEVLSDFEKSKIIAGDGNEASWDCTINAFVSYMSGLGYSINKNDLITDYIQYTGISMEKIKQDGGIENGSFSNFISSRFQINRNQIYSLGDSFLSSYTIAVNMDGGQVDHTVKPLRAYKDIDPQTGKEVVYVAVHDPTINKDYNVKWEDVKGLFEFGTESLYGLPGYFGFEYGYNGNGYNNYNGYGYNGNSENDYNQYGYGYNGYGYYYGYGYGYSY